MRRYDEPVEVRRGGDQEPEMFLWRGRVWKVRDVVARWVETGAWWESTGAGAVLGTEEAAPARGGTAVADDLLAEREVWRVVAGRGARGRAAQGPTAPEAPPEGVFDLCLDWEDGRWRLVSCAD